MITINAPHLITKTGINELRIGEEYGAMWALVDFYIRSTEEWIPEVEAVDLGGDNMLTFWVDEGEKKPSMILRLRQGETKPATRTSTPSKLKD